MGENKLITMDFEGTLVDFQWNLTRAVNETITVLSQKGIPAETFNNMNYAAIYNLVQEKGADWGFSGNQLGILIDHVYEKYDLEAASRWKSAERLLGTLKLLNEYKLAIVTNIGRNGLEQVLSLFGLQNIFGLIVTRNDVRFLKPAAEGLLKAIDWARVKKEDTIHIGDSLTDIETARNAGVKVGIVLGGENQKETLLREQPDIVIEKLTELPGVLKNMGF